MFADVGYSTASAASMAALGAMNADIVLLAGDLAYSDGQHDIWDYYGLLTEAVLPILAPYCICLTQFVL